MPIAENGITGGVPAAMVDARSERPISGAAGSGSAATAELEYAGALNGANDTVLKFVWAKPGRHTPARQAESRRRFTAGSSKKEINCEGTGRLYPHCA
jgi:hypothetical protein